MVPEAIDNLVFAVFNADFGECRAIPLTLYLQVKEACGVSLVPNQSVKVKKAPSCVELTSCGRYDSVFHFFSLGLAAHRHPDIRTD